MDDYNKGFTLIELTVVMAILSMLIAASLIMLKPAELRKRERDGRRRVDLEAIRQALELYRADKNSYPSNGAWKSDLEGGYIDRVPSDPGKYQYYYNRTSNTTYELCAHLELETGPARCGNNCNGSCNYRVLNP